MSYKVEISHKTIIFTVFFLIGLYTLFLIRDILFGVFVAILLMSAINPLVKYLESKGASKLLAIWISYLAFFSIVVAILATLVPALTNQLAGLANTSLAPIKEYLQDYRINLADIQIITQQLANLPQVYSALTSTFSFVIMVVTVLVMTFYLLVERQNMHRHLSWFFNDEKAEDRAAEFVDKVEMQIGRWLRGEVLLMFIVGTAVYIGLSILGVPYALPLALFAGLMEIAPNIGPLISAIPAILVGLTVSPLMAVAVAVLYIFIQQAENSLLIPQIMKKATGINPLITIVLVLAGYRLGGAGGAIMAIPMFLIAKVVIVEYYRVKSKKLPFGIGKAKHIETK